MRMIWKQKDGPVYIPLLGRLIGDGSRHAKRLLPASLLFVLTTVVVLSAMAFSAQPVQAAAGINQQLNYQARLLNASGAVVADGTYNIRFKIYQDGAGTTAGNPGGTLKWTELWQNSNSQGVTVKNGYLSANLGSICVLSGGSCQGNTNAGVDFSQDTLWLSIDIGGTATGASPTYDGEMVPMRRLTASPYALNAGQLGGLTAAQFIQNTTSAQTANFNITGTGTANTFIASTLQGNTVDASTASTTLNIGTTNANTISLNQNTTLASSKTLNVQGAATFQNASNSTSALAVKNAGGSSTVLDVDTTNGYVGIGTATPSRTLDVAINNSQTTAPMALLEQAGSGDASLEVKTSAKSFILGLDASDSSKFKISSSTANANTVLGNNSAGANATTGLGDTTSGEKVTTGSSGGPLSSINVLIGTASASSHLSVAIYTDNGGSPSQPGTLIASGASQNIVPNATNSFAVSATLAASTNYWLVFNTDDTATTFRYDVGAANVGCFSGRTYSLGWPASFGGCGTQNTSRMVMYGIYAASGASYDSFGTSLLTLGDTGQTIFKNSANSTTAFQVQNALANSIFNIDTTNSYVGIGTTTPSASLHVAGTALFKNTSNSTTAFQIQNASGGALLAVDSNTNNGYLKVGGGDISTGTTPVLLTLDHKTTTGDPTNTVEGSMYYNAFTKSFRCYINAAWRGCVAGVVSANTNQASLPGGDTVTNTTSEGTFTENYTIPANDCQPGRVYSIVAQGTLSTAATPGTLLLRLKIGSVTIVSTPTSTVTSNLSSRGWRIDAQVTCITAGSSGTLEGHGMAQWGASSALDTIAGLDMVTTSQSTVNTTTNQNLQLSATWGTAFAGNSITLRQFVAQASGG